MDACTVGGSQRAFFREKWAQRVKLHWSMRPMGGLRQRKKIQRKKIKIRDIRTARIVNIFIRRDMAARHGSAKVRARPTDTWLPSMSGVSTVSAHAHHGPALFQVAAPQHPTYSHSTIVSTHEHASIQRPGKRTQNKTQPTSWRRQIDV